MFAGLSLPSLAALAIVALSFSYWLLRALTRWRSIPTGTWVRITLSGRISEIDAPMSTLQRWLRRRRPTPWSVVALRRVVHSIVRDRRIAGIVFEVHDLTCGWATAQSLRDVIASVRAGKKQSLAWLPRGAMTREYLVALAAERIAVFPQASIAPLGVASSQRYYRSLLARLGIEAETLSRKEYKSAIEPWTRDASSDESREQTTAILESLHASVVSAIAESRAIDASRAREIIDSAPYRAAEAKERALVDSVAYEDELPTLLGRDAPELLRAGRYARLARPFALRKRLGHLPRADRKRVGVVEVRGTIVHDAPFGGSRVADAVRVISSLRLARRDPSIGAVVLYVDSPGGSGLASDMIAREVERLKEKKPVVAFMGDVAASGGYYVSALANEIVAQPTTVTGSIGVFALRLVFEKALEKLSIGHEVIRKGARADVMNPYRKWTDEERAALDREIDAFYRDFVEIVARGRRRSPDQIEPLARGRVWAGGDAQRAGLVDRLGGLDVAVERAAALAGMRGGGEPVVVPVARELPEPPEPLAKLDPVISRLGLSTGTLALALCAPTERFFAFDDIQFD